MIINDYSNINGDILESFKQTKDIQIDIIKKKFIIWNQLHMKLPNIEK